jgi:hypothetical protein
MESVKGVVLAQKPSSVEHEELFLPSFFPSSQRSSLSLSDLADEEAELREGQLLECIMTLRSTVKSISWFHRYRRENDRGQRQNALARSNIDSAISLRDRTLKLYNESRGTLQSLNSLGPEGRFPPLSQQDLFRKSTWDKRQVGDTYRPDGRVWSAGRVGDDDGGSNASGNYIITLVLLHFTDLKLPQNRYKHTALQPPHSQRVAEPLSQRIPPILPLPLPFALTPSVAQMKR